jgi:hypothetical protein
MAKNKPHVNIASGDDRVAMQVGQVTGRRTAKTDPVKTSRQAAGTGRTVNIVAGNARVGIQADRLDGDITITF